MKLEIGNWKLEIRENAKFLISNFRFQVSSFKFQISNFLNSKNKNTLTKNNYDKKNINHFSSFNSYI